MPKPPNFDPNDLAIKRFIETMWKDSRVVLKAENFGVAVARLANHEVKNRQSLSSSYIPVLCVPNLVCGQDSVTLSLSVQHTTTLLVSPSAFSIEARLYMVAIS